jgi:hypothetical protein
MLVIAHRGASGHAPENTMAAFRLASIRRSTTSSSSRTTTTSSAAAATAGA